MKRARQALKRRARNRSTINAVRTFERKLRAAVAKKDKKVAQELLNTFTSKIGKAAAKGALKKEAASRKISRLSELVAKSL